MDRLIHDLYKKKIVEIKKTELKNGIIIPIQINLLRIFDYPNILEDFLAEFNNFLIINKLRYNFVFGKNDLCKNICTLLSYKYNCNNIIRDNLYNYRINDEFHECLLIKENMGNSEKTNKLIKTLNSFNIKICATISLINYNTTKTQSNTFYFFDIYKIIQVLYKKEVIDYNKFINIYSILADNSYLNFKDRLRHSESKVGPIIEKIINKKTLLIFCCSVIQKLDFKDLIRTLDFVGNHVSIVKIDNLKNYNEVEIKSLIKLSIHHNFKILSNKIYDKLNFIQLLNINELFDQSYNFDSRLYIINDNILGHDHIKLNLLQNIKKDNNVIGVITDNNLFLQENKLKIFNILKLQDNILENKLVRENYDLLIVNSTETLVSLKHLSWNLYEKKKS
jgi:hypothetical protein